MNQKYSDAKAIEAAQLLATTTHQQVSTRLGIPLGSVADLATRGRRLMAAKAQAEPVVSDGVSLRTAILEYLYAHGTVADSRKLLGKLSAEDQRWRHQGLHSLHHVLHSLAKQNLITMTVKTAGTQQRSLESLTITAAGKMAIRKETPKEDLQRLDRMAAITNADEGRAHDAALVEKAKVPVPRDHVEPANGFAAEIDEADAQTWGEAPPRDPLDAALRAEDPFFHDHGEPSGPEGTALRERVHDFLVQDPTNGQFAGSHAILVMPAQEPEFPLLERIKERAGAARGDALIAEKLLEAAAILDGVATMESQALERKAQEIASANQLTTLEREYLEFALAQEKPASPEIVDIGMPVGSDVIGPDGGRNDR